MWLWVSFASQVINEINSDRSFKNYAECKRGIMHGFRSCLVYTNIGLIPDPTSTSGSDPWAPLGVPQQKYLIKYSDIIQQFSGGEWCSQIYNIRMNAGNIEK